MLRLREVHAGYGATPILFGVSLEVRQGEAVALLGKNGMGKTTLMKTAMGFLRPWRGTIEFDGQSLIGLRPHEIARRGVGLSAVRGRSSTLRRERLGQVFDHFPRLRERLDQPGKTLSGGEQQMLAIA